MTLPANHPYYLGIEAALRADDTHPTLQELTANRFHADQLPDDAELPAVRYALLLDTPAQRFDSADSTTADLQVDVYCHRGDVARAWAIDAAVRRVLDRGALPAGTVDGFAEVRAVCVMRGVPLREAPYFRIRSQYRLFGSRT